MTRRRKKLVRPDVQLRVILVAFSVASLVLLAVYNLSVSAVWMVSAQWGNAVTGLALEELKSALLRRFLLSGALVIPLSLGLGLVFSFKFAGPLYRFKRFFSELKEGRWDARCHLRKGDDLQDICAAINGGLAPLEEFLRENRSILEETRAVLAEGGPPADGEGRSRLEALDRRIADALATYQRRLPATLPEASSAPSERESAAPEGEESGEALASAREEELETEALRSSS